MTQPVATPDLKARLASRQQQIDARLDRLLPPATARPSSIHQALRHSVFAGGKRVRPILCLEAAAAVQPDGPEPLDLACALECIHTYSLIHDDLPALDNDDFRRGKPTSHKVFGEAIAILAGDALLTLAFEIIGHSGSAKLVTEIAAAAGTIEGMIGGQVIDLESEGKYPDSATLEYMHRSKTGALLRASVRSGAIFAGGEGEVLQCLTRYGEHLGLLFQIVDDMLDVEQSSATLGKTAGKDAKQKKLTFPAVYGLEKSREMAHFHLKEALAAVEMLGPRGIWLHELAVYVGQRKS